MIEARHLGYAILFDVNSVCSVWFCNKCESIFHVADFPSVEREVTCLNCKEKIKLVRRESDNSN